MARVNVVVPAHNERHVINRCLQSLEEQTYVGDLRVVVACNGCTDNTAELARRAGVSVVETAVPSKIGALNLGDNTLGLADVYIYLDADTSLSPGAVEAISERLTASSTPLVVMPRLEWNLSHSGPAVRAFQRAYSRTPYMTSGLIGAGCYAVNASGRRRWTQFPDVIADDLFVQERFKHHERETIESEVLNALAPRDLQSLIKQRTRTYLGNRQISALGASNPHEPTRPALRYFIRDSRWSISRALENTVYVAVNLVAKYRAKRTSFDAGWITDSDGRS